MTIAAKTTFRRASIAAVTALSIAAIPAAPALAWGDKEQGFLAGVVTAVIVDELIQSGKHRRNEPVHRPAPVYVDPTPSYTPGHGTSYTSVHATPAGRAFASYSREERRAIQRQLRYQGYYSGGIDGAFGPGTYRAVTAYARDAGVQRNLQSTGGAFAVYDGLLY